MNDDDRKPRRTRITEGLWQLDYLSGYLEVVDKDGEILVTATRFMPSQGASFCGWVVRCGSVYTDPIGTKKEAIVYLRDWAIQHP